MIRGLVAAIAILLLAAACGGSASPAPSSSASISPADEITPGGNTVAQVEADAQKSAEELGPAQSAIDYTAQLDLAVGETGHMLDGTEVTLHGVEDPIVSTTGGHRWDTDIEICAPADATVQSNFLIDFAVWLDTKTTAKTGSPLREPSLGTATIPPGQCLRGWRVWDIPEGANPVSVTYNGMFGGEMLQWKLGQAA